MESRKFKLKEVGFMKKIYLGILGVLLIVSTGCLPSAGIQRLPTTSGTYYNKNYELNEEKTISVGEKLLEINGVKNGVATIHPEFISQNEIRVNPQYLDNKKIVFNIRKSEILEPVGTVFIEKERYYIINLNEKERESKSKEVSRQSMLINEETLKIYPRILSRDGKKDYGVLIKTIFSEDVSLKRLGTRYSVLNPKDGVNFDIVYNGVSRDTLRFSYREFTNNDVARPAFSQDLTYNRNEKIIKFRGIEIEILKVTNSELTYRIRHDGMETTINQ